MYLQSLFQEEALRSLLKKKKGTTSPPVEIDRNREA
jgi:hypothetical protein